MDWGSLAYLDQDGRKHRIWVFVMTMGWSRACYVELVRKADTAAFIQCHVNAFETWAACRGAVSTTMPRW